MKIADSARENVNGQSAWVQVDLYIMFNGLSYGYVRSMIDKELAKISTSHDLFDCPDQQRAGVFHLMAVIRFHDQPPATTP